MIRMQFVLGGGLSSRAIAWFAAGHYSHIDSVLPDDSLLGARSDRVGHRPPGVQIRPAFYERWKERSVIVLHESPAVTKRYYDFLREQIGLPYDMTAIYGFAAGRDWREANSWYCSELAAAALEYSEAVPKLCAPTNKIMPGSLALVMTAIGAHIVT